MKKGPEFRPGPEEEHIVQARKDSRAFAFG
jgi:hypothetical protein